jgi:RimJ/RimL family protein N-acetyltransferase
VVTLRELKREDLVIVNGWRAQRSVIDGVSAPFRHIGLDVDVEWFEQYLTRRQVDVRCAICVEGDEPIGLVSLTNIDTVHRHADFHILIGPDSVKGKGVGTAATRAMLQHGFGDLNLHRVSLTVLAGNARAIRVYEKVGFKREGLLRDAVYKNGGYQDLIAMALLSHEIEPA